MSKEKSTQKEQSQVTKPKIIDSIDPNLELPSATIEDLVTLLDNSRFRLTVADLSKIRLSRRLDVLSRDMPPSSKYFCHLFDPDNNLIASGEYFSEQEARIEFWPYRFGRYRLRICSEDGWMRNAYIHFVRLKNPLFFPNLNDDLDKLFERWIAKSEEENEPREEGTGKIIFTRDGLLEKNDPSIDVSQDWVNASRRILFILKDQPTEWSDDARLWLKDLGEAEQHADIKKRNRELGTPFFQNLANIFYGLLNATDKRDCLFSRLAQDRVVSCFNTKPFGFMEMKKQGGEHSIDDNVLKEYVAKYVDFLNEEINVLRANIFVCTSPVIFDFFTKKGRDSGTCITFGEAHSGMCYDPKRKTLFLTSYHPSARKSYADFYERVMNDFRFFLRSEYANKFFLKGA